MSLLYILLIFAVWLGGPSLMVEPRMGVPASLGVFLGGYVALVLGVAGWTRMLARRLDGQRLHHGAGRLNRMLMLARLAVPAWLAAGVFTPLGFGRIILDALSSWAYVKFSHGGDTTLVGLALPAAVLGTLPSLLAWVGLWWAQYPADRAMREQSLLGHMHLGLPVRSPPPLGQYIAIQVRLQLLFVVAPLLLVLLLRDAAVAAIALAGGHFGHSAAVQDWLILPAAVPVLLLAPELLRRIWRTEPLPDSPLRRRLEKICRHMRLRYRDILLWHTHGMTANAAVMGLVGPLRYVLLSDWLLETLTDEQIEAVFAHEVGHVVHHHMAWYALFFAMVALASGVLDAALARVMRPGLLAWAAHLIDVDAATLARTGREAVVVAGMIALTLGGFTVIGRMFERQADVFAARMLESNWEGIDRARLLRGSPEMLSYLLQTMHDDPPPAESPSRVGPRGAAAFISALDRVARVNSISTRSRSWPHGSMGGRMEYLSRLAADPLATEAFDRRMRRLYRTLLAATALCAVAALLLPSG